MPGSDRTRTRRVALLAHEGVQLLDVVGPMDVFDIANHELAAANAGPGYVLELVSSGRAAFKSSSGISLVAQLSIDDFHGGPGTTFLMAGGRRAEEEAKRREVADAVRRIAPAVERIGAICSGAWFLAEAGLLSGRRAVTHWAACARLAAAHPTIRVEPDAIFVRDGAVWTSAGITAGIDLALAMVEDDHGRAVALSVARILVVYCKRPGGQSQFSTPLAAQMAERSPLRDLQLEIISRPGDDLSVETLATRVHMSPRNFARTFARETGLTPAAFVEGVRVDAARRLLEEADLAAEQIARRCGFGEPDTMRRAFLRRLGVTPRDYRARFRSTGLHGNEPRNE